MDFGVSNYFENSQQTLSAPTTDSTLPHSFILLQLPRSSDYAHRGIAWPIPGLPYSKLAQYTDKKENQIFLIYREIQSGAVAKSYMRKGFLIYEEMR